jgi:hypothetical protein
VVIIVIIKIIILIIIKIKNSYQGFFYIFYWKLMSDKDSI